MTGRARRTTGQQKNKKKRWIVKRTNSTFVFFKWNFLFYFSCLSLYIVYTGIIYKYIYRYISTYPILFSRSVSIARTRIIFAESFFNFFFENRVTKKKCTIPHTHTLAWHTHMHNTSDTKHSFFFSPLFFYSLMILFFMYVTNITVTIQAMLFEAIIARCVALDQPNIRKICICERINQISYGKVCTWFGIYACVEDLFIFCEIVIYLRVKQNKNKGTDSHTHTQQKAVNTILETKIMARFLIEILHRTDF